MMIQHKQQQQKTKNGNIGRTTNRGLKYRSKVQIMGEILLAASQRGEGLTKTKIMYKALLSFAQIKDYLSNMVGDALLEFHDDTKRYTVTPKGFKFLERYRGLAEMLPDIDLCDNEARGLHL
jgi:predicted transcriptional regulator